MDITSLILSKKYIEDSLTGAGALKGKSAYEVAQANGFTGSEEQWLASLVGTTPHIGTNGNWFIGIDDTGVIASPVLAGYATEDWVKEEISKITFPEVDLTPYATKEEVKNAVNNIKIPETDLSNYATKDDLANVTIDLSGYATEEYVNDKVENLELSSGVIVESLTEQEILNILITTGEKYY